MSRWPDIMAICTDASRSGCTVYSDSIIHMLGDKKDINEPYKGIDLVLQRTEPEIVIVSGVNKKLIDYIEKRFTVKIIDISKRYGIKVKPTEVLIPTSEEVENVGEIMNVETSFDLVIVPNMWFSMSRGVQKLLDSELVKSKGFSTQEEKSLFITSKVEKSTDVCALRSISAVDSYITHMYAIQSENELAKNQQVVSQQSQTSDNQTLPESNHMPIIDVKYIDPGPVLSIDKFSLEALGIFHKVKRKYYKGADDDDVNAIPSLYEILNLCTSIQGKRQLRTMMMWPLQDITELTNRYDTIDYFTNPDNILLRDQLALHLKNVVPLSQVITKLNQAIGTYREFTTIYKAMWAFVAVMDIIKANNNHNLVILDRIVELDSCPLRTVVESIMNVVDFEASLKEKRIQVCVGVDQNVDDKKEIAKNLSKFCDEVAVQETSKYRDKLGKICRVLYVPRIGFLNSIDYSSTSELLAIKTNKEFDVVLYTEQSIYFKTERMEQLDANAGDIACDLIDVQENVIVNLQEELLKHSETILKLMDLCGQLDCLIAFSIVSLQRGYIRPEFTSNNEDMKIIQAYHPLYSTRNNIVPNDVNYYNEMSERKVKIMIITGPNSCGKTTYMKTTCLIIFMAHIGCFVPASYAQIPVIDAILTRMHSANSISTGLSSFATDLHQINYAIRKATRKSLIAIDEFGKGTLASDGFHLLKGLMMYFATCRQDGAYVMVSTHFNRLINHLKNYNEYILYKTFKVTNDPIRDTITYEFTLMNGVGDMSLSDKVAALAGVPQFIVERANQIRDYITANRQIRPIAPRGA